MPKCDKCGNMFPNRIKIDDKWRNIHNRKYCLECSPFGKHNTKKLNGEPIRSSKTKGKHRCSHCGEENPNKFYGNKKSICGRCHNQYTLKVGQEKRQKAIDYLGGECIICKYSGYYGSFDFHHIDPNKKDTKFNSLRSWAWERIKIELENCVLLCATCHREVHGGIKRIEDYI